MEPKVIRRQRPMRGLPYSLEEFATRYDLEPSKAKEIFDRFGPSSVDLDLLMVAKNRSPSDFLM